MAVSFHTIKKNWIIFDLSTLEYMFLIHFVLSRFWSLASIWVIFLTSQGLNLTQIAIINIFYFGSMFIFEIPTGIIADKFGRKVSLMISYLLQAIGIFIFAISSTMPLFLMAFFLWGVGQTMTSGADQAWIYDEIKYQEEGNGGDFNTRYQQIYGFLMGVGLITTAVAYFVGGFLAQYNLRWGILINSISFALATIWITQIPEHHYAKETDEHHDDTKQSNIREAIGLLKQPTMIILLVTSMIMGGLVSNYFYWMQPFLHKYNVSLTTIGLVLGVGVFVASIGSRRSTLITEKVGSSSLFFIVACTAIAFTIMEITAIYGAFLIYLIIRGLRGMFLPYFSKLINQQIPTKVRATVLSLISACTMLAIMVSELISAYIIDHLGFQLFYRISSIFLIGLLPFLFIYRERIVSIPNV